MLFNWIKLAFHGNLPRSCFWNQFGKWSLYSVAFMFDYVFLSNSQWTWFTPRFSHQTLAIFVGELGISYPIIMHIYGIMYAASLYIDGIRKFQLYNIKSPILSFQHSVEYIKAEIKVLHKLLSSKKWFVEFKIWYLH